MAYYPNRHRPQRGRLQLEKHAFLHGWPGSGWVDRGGYNEAQTI